MSAPRAVGGSFALSSSRSNSSDAAASVPRKAQGEDSRESAQTFAEAVDLVAHQSRNERGQRMTVADIAERIGRPENYLRKATSQYDDAHPLRGDLIVPLTLATKNFALLTYMARTVGGVFFRLPAVEDDGHLDIIGQTARVVGEFGEVLSDIRLALADGTITKDEAHRVAVAGNEAIAEIARLVNLVERKADA